MAVRGGAVEVDPADGDHPEDRAQLLHRLQHAGGGTGPGRLDSPRWPGSPKDNTFPYRTGQLALHEQGGDELRDRFATGWWISDRTPLTGLDFAWVAGAFDVAVRTDDPVAQPTAQVPMRTVDPWGFWAYQLVAMLMSIATVLGVFLLGRLWLGARVATVQMKSS